MPPRRVPLDMNVDLNKSEFRDAVKLRYDWEVPDMPSVCVCGDHFHKDHAMICKRGGFWVSVFVFIYFFLFNGSF